MTLWQITKKLLQLNFHIIYDIRYFYSTSIFLENRSLHEKKKIKDLKNPVECLIFLLARDSLTKDTGSEGGWFSRTKPRLSRVAEAIWQTRKHGTAEGGRLPWKESSVDRVASGEVRRALFNSGNATSNKLQRRLINELSTHRFRYTMSNMSYIFKPVISLVPCFYLIVIFNLLTLLTC